MKHPNAFPHDESDQPSKGRKAFRSMVILKVIIVALVVLLVVALHIFGIVGLGSHLGG